MEMSYTECEERNESETVVILVIMEMSYTEGRHCRRGDQVVILVIMEISYTAKHFFELGLKL